MVYQVPDVMVVLPEITGLVMFVLAVNCHSPLFVVLMLNTTAGLPIPPAAQLPRETPTVTNAVPTLSIIASMLTVKG